MPRWTCRAPHHRAIRAYSIFAASPRFGVATISRATQGRVSWTRSTPYFFAVSAAGSPRRSMESFPMGVYPRKSASWFQKSTTILPQRAVSSGVVPDTGTGWRRWRFFGVGGVGASGSGDCARANASRTRVPSSAGVGAGAASGAGVDEVGGALRGRGLTGFHGNAMPLGADEVGLVAKHIVGD